MVLLLYMIEFSPLARAVQITADILGIKLELKKVDILKNEYYFSEYSQINPTHSVPTLVDGEVIICDNHAINLYLIRKHGKNSKLYPEDFVRRASLDERLFFNSSYLFPYLKAIVKGRLLNEVDVNKSDIIKHTVQSYGYLEKFLEKYEWMGGNFITLADITLLPTLNSLDALVPIDEKRFTKLKSWINKVQGLPEFNKDEKGLQAFKALIKQLFPHNFGNVS